MKYNFTLAPFSRAFVENKDKTIGERISLGMLAAARYLPVSFDDNCMLPTVFNVAENDGCGFAFNTGIVCYDERFDEYIANNPEFKEQLKELKEEMSNICTYNIWYGKELSEKDNELIDIKACWGGGWTGHGNPDYQRLLHLGTDGIRDLISKYKEMHQDRAGFYNGCELMMCALDKVGERIQEVAKQNLINEKDNKKIEEYKRIINVFNIIPKKPAFDMYSAVMMFWMFYTLDGNDSPGRFDQYMYDFYQVSDEKERDEMLTRFLEGMHNVRGWNLCISGSDENYIDQTNELSYAILEKVKDLGYQTPNLTMRVHRNTPEKLWRLASECIGTGIGLPSIYNDEVVCAALEKIGIEPKDSHNYCMNGCNQIEIMGTSHMGLEDGEVNFAKVLEFTLHNGYEGKSSYKKIVSKQFGNAVSCKSFKEFMNLYYKQFDYIIDYSVNLANRYQEIHANYCPNPMRSCLIYGCIEKALDYEQGGPKYNHGQILAEGIADTADSLYAIKKLIFEDKKYTMSELILALKNDFVGYEKLYFDFKKCDKFGNDIDEVDEICSEIVDHFMKYLKTKHTYRGGIYTGGCSPFNRASQNGLGVSTLPNGKKDKDPSFADSIAATPGCDKNGPTASIKSMLKYNQVEACSGFVAQLKFSKSMFNTEKGINSFISLAKTYFKHGGQQLSINVLDKHDLIEAQKDPEKYKSLIVRVGGYSDYFCNLTPELQKNIIDRTEFIL